MTAIIKNKVKEHVTHLLLDFKESELIKKSLGILAHDPCYANKCRTCRYYEFFNEKKDGVCNYFRNVFMHNGEFGGFKGRIVCTECGGTYEFVNNEYTCKTCKEKEVVCGQI